MTMKENVSIEKTIDFFARIVTPPSPSPPVTRPPSAHILYQAARLPIRSGRTVKTQERKSYGYHIYQSGNAHL